MTKKTLNKKIEVNNTFDFELDQARITMIQMLIPLGLKAIEEALMQEVEALARKRYERNDSDFSDRIPKVGKNYFF